MEETPSNEPLLDSPEKMNCNNDSSELKNLQPSNEYLIRTKDIKDSKDLSDHKMISNSFNPKEKTTVTDYLVKNNKTNTSYVANKSIKNAKKAVLDYEVLGRDEDKNLTLLSVNLHTGRSHQIRVQLANLGYQSMEIKDTDKNLLNQENK